MCLLVDRRLVVSVNSKGNVQEGGEERHGKSGLLDFLFLECGNMNAHMQTGFVCTVVCVCAPVFLSSWAPSGLYLGFTVTDRIILRLILIMVSRGSS